MHQFSLVPRRKATVGHGIFAKSIDQDLPDLIQLKNVFSNQQFFGILQSGIDVFGARNFTDAGDVVFSDYFQYRAQGIGCMQSCGIQERRIDGCDGGNVYFFDAGA